MSASSARSLRPWADIAAERLTVTEDLGTQPLPLATACTRVRELGLANGSSLAAWPPRSFCCSAWRCSSLMTSRSTCTPETPGTLDTAAVTSRVIVSRRGQPATGRNTPTLTLPSGVTSTPLIMSSSVMGRRISGSFTVASAAVTCSIVGEAMCPWYLSGGAPGEPPYAVAPSAGLLAAVLQLFQQVLELVADPVAGGDVAHRHPEAGHLPGQVLGVGDVALVARPVALVLDAVAVGLAVLGEQDQRRGVRGLEGQHQRQEDERVRVEPPRRGGQDVPGEPREDEDGHVDQEPGGAEEPSDALGELPERLRVVVHPWHQRPPDLARLVEAADAALVAQRPVQASAHHHSFTDRFAVPVRSRAAPPPRRPPRCRRRSPCRSRASRPAGGGRARRRP